MISIWTLTGRFILLDDGFEYKNIFYPFSKVVHIHRYAQKTSLNFIPLENHLKIKLYVNERNWPITLGSTVLPGFRSKVDKAYEILANETFKYRISHYLYELDNNGYFYYQNYRFYKNGDVTYRDTTFSVHDVDIWLETFKLVFKIKKGIFGKKIRVSTLIDQDVILALLDHCYGITFS